MNEEKLKNEEINNFSTDEQLLEKINTIIRLHLLKSLTKIQEILHSNNIYLNDDKLYRIITKFRNINFPKDEEYLSYKNNLTIT